MQSFPTMPFIRCLSTGEKTISFLTSNNELQLALTSPDQIEEPSTQTAIPSTPTTHPKKNLGASPSTKEKSKATSFNHTLTPTKCSKQLHDNAATVTFPQLNIEHLKPTTISQTHIMPANEWTIAKNALEECQRHQSPPGSVIFALLKAFPLNNTSSEEEQYALVHGYYLSMYKCGEFSAIISTFLGYSLRQYLHTHHLHLTGGALRNINSFLNSSNLNNIRLTLDRLKSSYRELDKALTDTPPQLIRFADNAFDTPPLLQSKEPLSTSRDSNLNPPLPLEAATRNTAHATTPSALYRFDPTIEQVTPFAISLLSMPPIAWLSHNTNPLNTDSLHQDLSSHSNTPSSSPVTASIQEAAQLHKTIIVIDDEDETVSPTDQCHATTSKIKSTLWLPPARCSQIPLSSHLNSHGIVCLSELTSYLQPLLIKIKNCEKEQPKPVKIKYELYLQIQISYQGKIRGDQYGKFKFGVTHFGIETWSTLKTLLNQTQAPFVFCYNILYFLTNKKLPSESSIESTLSFDQLSDLINNISRPSLLEIKNSLLCSLGIALANTILLKIANTGANCSTKDQSNNLQKFLDHLKNPGMYQQVIPLPSSNHKKKTFISDEVSAFNCNPRIQLLLLLIHNKENDLELNNRIGQIRNSSVTLLGLQRSLKVHTYFHQPINVIVEGIKINLLATTSTESNTFRQAITTLCTNPNLPSQGNPETLYVPCIHTSSSQLHNVMEQEEDNLSLVTVNTKDAEGWNKIFNLNHHLSTYGIYVQFIVKVLKYFLYNTNKSIFDEGRPPEETIEALKTPQNQRYLKEQWNHLIGIKIGRIIYKAFQSSKEEATGSTSHLDIETLSAISRSLLTDRNLDKSITSNRKIKSFNLQRDLTKTPTHKTIAEFVNSWELTTPKENTSSLQLKIGVKREASDVPSSSAIKKTRP